MVKFSGIYPALVTPMHDDLSVHERRLRELVELQISAGIDGLWLCGGSGEAELLSADERRLIADTVMEAARGRVKVIVHVGAVAPLGSFELAKHAEACGADAVACTPPHFYTVGDQNLVDHYRRLTDACGLPAFLYHLPGCTHVPLTLGLAERLLELPGIAGVKFSDFNLNLMRRIRNLAPERLSIFFGMDSILLAALVMGADGGVGGSYNYLSPAYVGIYEAFRRGDLEAAQTLQHRTTDFNQALMGRVPQLAAMKAAMSLAGIDCGPPRPPFARPGEDEMQRMRRWWQEHGEFLESIGLVGS